MGSVLYRKMIVYIGLAGISLAVLPSCEQETVQPERPADTPIVETIIEQPVPPEKEKIDYEKLGEALAEFNRGAGLLEQYQYVDAAKAFENVLQTAPDWTAAKFNLGLAQYNLQESAGAEDSLEKSQQTFQEILADNPDHLHSMFCLGLYYQHIGNNEKALGYFEKVYEADGEDLYAAYKYAETLLSLDRKDDGTEILIKIVDHDPGFISAVYRLALQYQRLQQRDKALPLFERFRKLKEVELTGGTFTVLKAYGTVGKYYMALGADNLPLQRAEIPPQPVLFSPEVMTIDVQPEQWTCPGGKVSSPGIATADIDGDGDLDVCITGIGPDNAAMLLLNDGKGHFTIGQKLADAGTSPCFGDGDNDGNVDLWLGRAGTDMYFQNDGNGNMTRALGEELGGADLVTSCARMFDADSDGDLDFLAIRMRQGSIPLNDLFEPGGGSLYNNNRDGSFTDIAEALGLDLSHRATAAFLYDDFDNDRDQDIVIFPAGGDTPICIQNNRMWQYKLIESDQSGLDVSHVISATTGDPDKDGDRDVLVFHAGGVDLFLNNGMFGFKKDQIFADRCSMTGGSGGQFADMDNDGDLDIVIADGRTREGKTSPTVLINEDNGKRFTNLDRIDPGNLLAAVEVPQNTSFVAADFTGNGRCDILIAGTGQKCFLIENVTQGSHWVQFDLSGTRPQDGKSRSNNSAIGARVEVKAGNVHQQFIVGAPAGSVSMPPYRIHAGLGKNAKVDWLRIVWPDAVLQAELELAAGQVHAITELQRKTSSCPHLFAWDGRHFKFVADFGGMGGVGYMAAPGEYAKPDPTEYLPLGHIQPLDGEYILQVLEPLEETVFFDEARLIAVDHPEGTTVYPNEMMAITADPPPFELFCYERTIEPVSVTDHLGRDVTENLAKIDRIYAGATDIDKRFTGYAEEHYVELDFTGRLAVPANGSRLVLFMHGWVEYPYSSTNFAAAQAKLALRAPSLYAFRGDKWVKIYHEVGYPAGLQHMMTLDVTGGILPTDRRFRIVSNMELFWDRIFFAEVMDQVSLSVQSSPVTSGDLHYLGFPRQYSPDGRHPNLFDYDNIDRTVGWKTMTGSYTRFGDVTDLLDDADDRYVIMGPGEELTLRFDANAFGKVPTGYTRSFIVKTDSFCKDMDLYSAWPDTVEPLPFHDMSGYPFKDGEQYPDDPKLTEYHKKYNTRKLGQ